jgi:rhodanese-related sulfurtransferase
MTDDDLHTIDADRLKSLLDRGQRLLIVDVRSPEEIRTGHIPGARSLAPAMASHHL